MNFDGYANYILKKYRLAVALAVIKTKPGDKDTNDHINNILRNVNERINENKMENIREEDFEYCEMNSNDSVTILKDFDINIDRIDDNVENNESMAQIITSIETSKNTKDTFFEETQCTQNSVNHTIDSDVTFCDSEITNMMIEPINDIINDSEINDKNVNNDCDTQQTVLYTLHETNTHISQSQDNIVIMKKYLDIKKDNNKIIKNNDSKVIEKMEDFKQIQKQINYAEYLNGDTQSTVNFNDNLNEQEFNITGERIDKISSSIGNNWESQFINSQTCGFNNLTSQDGQNVLRNTEIPKKITSISQNIYSMDEIEYFSSSEKNCNIYTKFYDKRNNDMKNVDEKMMGDLSDSNSEELTESQAELVSFKVLEELSKIKIYLNKLENSTDTDSGYRSLHTKSSFKSLKLSSCWNESAHCLLSFLTDCPLVVNIVDISEEISKVLGRFIDRLHEEEKYMKFMEFVLDTVDRFINEVYHSKMDDDNTMLKIDEKIQRIFLLNRSQHIIKFSIEKITIILEKYLQNKHIIEITETDKAENLCYIFNILEILLKRNIIEKKSYEKNQSQSTQSQETVLKRSSITEIWRKKWNLSKNELSDVEIDKKCVLNECRNVLNRIIVEAMDNYSLISFAALQCFNIMQN